MPQALSFFASPKRNHLLWLAWLRALRPLRPSCSRTTTFLWLVLVVAALCLRLDLAGVTSLVLGLQWEGPATVVADAYYAAAKFARALLKEQHHLVTRVRTNAVAYFPPKKPRRSSRRGRPRRYGLKTQLRDWFRWRKQFLPAPSPVYGESGITLRYLSHDLLWRPLGQGVRFVWVSNPTRGDLVLLCTDLSLAPLDIIRLFGWRFKIEVSFKQAIHTLGAYAYYFWMQDMSPIHRGNGRQFLQRKSQLYRDHVRRKLAAYERHIQLGLIAQGLLQYLALNFRRLTWLNFHSYIRTASPHKAPSGWVVAQALHHTWPEFLQSSVCSHILKKSLASKISPQRCGYSDVFDLGQTA